MKNKIFLISLVVLLLNSIAYSQIRYIDIIPDMVLTSPTSGSGSNSYCLDIDSNIVNDYVFSAGWVGCGGCPEPAPNTSKSSRFYSYNGSLISGSLKSEGQIIDSLTIGYLTNNILLLAYCCYTYIGCYGSQTGREYIPIKFNKDNQFYYGWVKASCIYGQVTIKSFAYNTIPGQPIIASENASGYIVGGDTICMGNATDTLVLMAYIGNIRKWQKRLNSGAWIDIANNSSTYIETPTSPGKWEYRAEVQHGPNIAMSDVGIVFVNDSPATPTITQSGLVLTSTSISGNQWYWNNNFIPGASSQNFTCTINGSYTDIVTINNCSSEPSEPININVGIDETINNNGFIIYPNPAEDNLTININSFDFSDIKLSIFNIQGQLVLQQTIKQFKSDINISQWREGVYIAKINFGDGTITQEKFVIIK